MLLPPVLPPHVARYLLDHPVVLVLVLALCALPFLSDVLRRFLPVALLVLLPAASLHAQTALPRAGSVPGTCVMQSAGLYEGSFRGEALHGAGRLAGFGRADAENITIDCFLGGVGGAQISFALPNLLPITTGLNGEYHVMDSRRDFAQTPMAKAANPKIVYVTVIPDAQSRNVPFYGGRKGTLRLTTLAGGRLKGEFRVELSSGTHGAAQVWVAGTFVSKPAPVVR